MDDVEAHRAKQAAAEAEAAAAVGNAGGANYEDDAEMEQSDDEEEAAARQKKEQDAIQKAIAQAQGMQSAAMNPSGPIKIRTDYVPSRKLPEKLFFSEDSFPFSGRQKEEQGHNDNLFHLSPTNTYRRVAGAYAY